MYELCLLRPSVRDLLSVLFPPLPASHARTRARAHTHTHTQGGGGLPAAARAGPRCAAHPRHRGRQARRPGDMSPQPPPPPPPPVMVDACEGRRPARPRRRRALRECPCTCLCAFCQTAALQCAPSRVGGPCMPRRERGRTAPGGQGAVGGVCGFGRVCRGSEACAACARSALHRSRNRLMRQGQVRPASSAPPGTAAAPARCSGQPLLIAPALCSRRTDTRWLAGRRHDLVPCAATAGQSHACCHDSFASGARVALSPLRRRARAALGRARCAARIRSVSRSPDHGGAHAALRGAGAAPGPGGRQRRSQVGRSAGRGVGGCGGDVSGRGPATARPAARASRGSPLSRCGRLPGAGRAG